MRITLLAVLVVLAGCESRVFHQECTGDGDNNRLCLRYVGSESPAQGYNFDALVWRTRSGSTWNDKVVITRADFQNGCPHRRWISEVHSLDSAAGTAIIKVAEGDAQDGAQQINFAYSWREWNLLTNSEVRLLRACADPGEKF